MKIELGKNKVTVIREKSDPKIYKESTFYYKVKLELIRLGFDVIRKDPQKETHFCHLTSMSYYIRGRKINDDTPMIFDNDYMIRSPCEDFNQTRQKELDILGDLNFAKFTT